MSRVPGVLVAVLLVASCSSDVGPGAGDGVPEDAPSAQRAVAKAAGPELQLARMQAGTDWSSGSLRAFCDGGRCAEDDGAAPERFLPLPASGLLLFVVARAPTEGRVWVTSRASGERVMRRELDAGTTMPLRAELDPGAYVVTLRARWERREARWLFGVRVPG